MSSGTPPAPLVSGSDLPSSSTKDHTAFWSLRNIQILWSWAARPKPAQPRYPPLSTIPRTSAARLSEPDVAPTPFPSEPILSRDFNRHAPTKPKTVLYLAYGSNMCAETFLGMRGIRPLSQVSVSAPSLDLTFDLPGIPYREPCFANTKMRKIPGKKPPFDPPVKPPAAGDESANDGDGSATRRDPVWTKGLYGVVYEVTAEDYARIVATEGGGASYHDILVPCMALPPSVRVPEQPAVPVPPLPFLAHTLYAPRLPPDQPGEGEDDKDENNKNNNKPRIPRWFLPLLRPARRPRPDYAQPSARYLKLLRDGAREHDLPGDYQAYLGALQPYTATTLRQRLGRVLFLGFWLPLVVLTMVTGRALADERGRSPPWLVAATTVMFNLVWLSYDYVGKWIFGDGERTIDEGDGERGPGRGRSASFASGLRGKEEADDEEKKALLDGYE